MKINIKQLGLIADAKFDLGKKLTVFCGPNNTGKTYVSYIIYALTKILLKAGVAVSKESMSELLKNGSVEISIDTNAVKDVRSRKIEYIKKQLGVIFGLPDDKASKYFSDFDMSFAITDEEHIDLVKSNDIHISANELIQGVHLEIMKPKDSMVMTLSYKSEEMLSLEKLDEFLNLSFINYIYQLLAFYPILQSSIYPVERVSVQTFFRQLSINAKNRVELHKEGNEVVAMIGKGARYPLAIKDNLDIAENLVNLQNQTSEYADLATEIETELLHGDLSITKTGEAEFKANGAKSKSLPAQITASVVKSLSSLTFYLRYMANGNDLVIIDEPELNLHPDSQIRLARIFGKMLNRNLRLLISTHSDYIVRELNNLIMLSGVSEEYIHDIEEKFGYERSMALNPCDVNAFLFTKNGRNKTEVKNISITKEGFEVKTIDSALQDLNEASDELYHLL